MICDKLFNVSLFGTTVHLNALPVPLSKQMEQNGSSRCSLFRKKRNEKGRPPFQKTALSFLFRDESAYLSSVQVLPLGKIVSY